VHRPISQTSDTRPHAIIIGGGLAGLSAGVDLAARGWRVSVLEARARLGGRASSYLDETTGHVVDNGQHAMMGCFHHTLRFLETIGASHKIVRQKNLLVEIRRQNATGVIRAARLPSPLHVAVAITRFSLLTPLERARALTAGLRILAMRRLEDPRLRSATVEEILLHLGQSQNARQCFWYPVVIATLNEQPDRAAAEPFAEVLARAFFGSRTDSQFIFAGVGLGDLYTGDAQNFIEKHGGSVQTRTQVTELVRTGRTAIAARLRDGQQLAAQAFVSAVPPRAAGVLLPELEGSAHFASSPIVSVHLWFDQTVLTRPFVGLVGTTAQWVFNRSRLLSLPDTQGQQLSVVISAAHDIVDRENNDILEAVLSDLKALLPSASNAKLRHSVVVREKHATISMTPGNNRQRPPTETPLRNVVLAGDWVQTGLPATIESAVLSGSRAAACIASRDGGEKP